MNSDEMKWRNETLNNHSYEQIQDVILTLLSRASNLVSEQEDFKQEKKLIAKVVSVSFISTAPQTKKVKVNKHQAQCSL